MLNTPWAEREIFKALQVIAAETETDLGEIIDALTGYAWGEEDRETLRKMIPDILADLDAEPPKPTGEQLKAIADIKVISGDKPTICKEGNCVWVGEEYGAGLWHYIKPNDELIGKLRWHLKDAPPQSTLMICNHAINCANDEGCTRQKPHAKQDGCEVAGYGSHPNNCPFPAAVCVPWVEPVPEPANPLCGTCTRENGLLCPMANDYRGNVRTCGDYQPKQPEPVVHTSCEGCAHEGINFFMCGGCFNQMETMSNQVRRNYTPKQPEPVVKKNFTAVEPEPAVPVKSCDTCRHCKGNWCQKHDGTGGIHCHEHGYPQWEYYLSKEPKAEPGLVSTVEETTELIKFICIANNLDADTIVEKALKHKRELQKATAVLSALK